MLDLDGVVYVGGEARPGRRRAPGRGAGGRACGWRSSPTTPPARRSRWPSTCASSGCEAERRGRRHLGPGGGPGAAPTGSARAPGWCCSARPGSRRRCAPEDLEPVGVDEQDAPGAGDRVRRPTCRWRDIMRAAVRVRDGLPWVASNTDLTIPTAYGLAPGHGVLVETLRSFSGVDPVVAGKPQRPLLDETVRRVGGERPLMVGDRLDTDIEGARTAGLDSLLVLTGVTGLAELVAAPPGAAADVPRPRPRRPARAPRRRRRATGTAWPSWAAGGHASTTAGSCRGRRASPATGGGWWPPPPGATSTSTARRPTIDGLSAPLPGAGRAGGVASRHERRPRAPRRRRGRPPSSATTSGSAPASTGWTPWSSTSRASRSARSRSTWPSSSAPTSSCAAPSTPDPSRRRCPRTCVRPDPAVPPVASGWTPSSSAAAWPARGSTPAS